MSSSRRNPKPEPGCCRGSGSAGRGTPDRRVRSGPPLAEPAGETRQELPPRGSPLAWGALAGALLFCWACKSESDRACLDQFSSAQAVVMDVEAEKLASVEAAVQALEGAVAACKFAGRTGEVEELGAAHQKLAAHRDRVLRRDELRRQKAEIPPADLAGLVKSGDPKCPRGQAYLHKKSNQRIRCTGPQPIDMNAAQATEYFKGRGYKLTPGAAARELRFEYGAELIVYRYRDLDSTVGAECVLLYPPPDMSWQEATARLTGVAPARLASGRALSGGAQPRAFVVEETQAKVVAQIGDCDPPSK